MNSRRDLLLSVPTLALLLQAAEMTAAAQQGETSPTPSTGAKGGTEMLARNQIFRAAELPVRPSANGSTQGVVQGTLLTGEGVELHNTVLLPGHEPHPPHQHVHAEFLLLREGDVTWLIDGKRQAASAGDILYAASQVLHGIRNTGTVPAKYFVLAIGPNLKSA